MILVLLGTNYFSFDRLVKEVDLNIATKHDVWIQIGETVNSPINSRFFKYEERGLLLDRINRSDLIITQGGYGSMMDSIQLNKKIIAVPRKIELNECLDDQAELVQYFESKKYVVGCYDINELEGLVAKCLAGEFNFIKYKAESKSKIKDMIQQELDDDLL